MNIYVVYRMGIVYMQGVVGVFGTVLLAKEAADIAKAKEPDDYHRFEIELYVLDGVYNPDWMGDEDKRYL